MVLPLITIYTISALSVLMMFVIDNTKHSVIGLVFIILLIFTPVINTIMVFVRFVQYSIILLEVGIDV